MDGREFKGSVVDFLQVCGRLFIHQGNAIWKLKKDSADCEQSEVRHKKRSLKKLVSAKHYQTFEYGKHLPSLENFCTLATTLASVWIIWRAGRTSVETEQMREGELA